MLYVLNILIALDQLANALLCGHPKETISRRCAKHLHQAAANGTPPPLLWHRLGLFLEWIDPGHLKKSWQGEHNTDSTFLWTHDRQP